MDENLRSSRLGKQQLIFVYVCLAWFERSDPLTLTLIALKQEHSENCGETYYPWCNRLTENIISKDCSRSLRLLLL